MRKNEKITALYERLSRDDFGKDDDQQRESNSISNQKAMLEEFAARQGFTNIVHFTDDGISGTCFDRPGFLAMMKEVEAGNVEYLCIKDMSRMGRDYLKVGQIMEILRQRGDAFDEPKQWEIREINEIMNQCISGWRYFPNPRMFSEYGRQKGWERENPATDSGNPSEKTMDGFVEVTEQMELPF